MFHVPAHKSASAGQVYPAAVKPVYPEPVAINRLSAESLRAAANRPAKSISVNLVLPDHFCAGVLCTALEGGIQYWCCAGSIKRCDVPADKRLWEGEWDYVSFIAYDNDDNSRLGVVDYDTVRLGIERILSGQVKVRDDIVGWIASDVQDVENAGMIDSDAADCIVQAGLLGEVRYG